LKDKFEREGRDEGDRLSTALWRDDRKQHEKARKTEPRPEILSACCLTVRPLPQRQQLQQQLQQAVSCSRSRLGQDHCQGMSYY